VSLSELLSGLTPDRTGGLSVAIPPDWLQGRTAFGGLNAALAGRAARTVIGAESPLRAVQIAFLAPAAGIVRYVPTVLRQGRSVTFVGVDAFAGADLCARAILTYGQPRDTEVTHSRLVPQVLPAPADCDEIPLVPGVTPAFLVHLELRFGAGSAPLSLGEPEFAWWVRHRDAVGLDPESAVLAVADVLPPAVMVSRTEFRPASSVTWTIDLAEPLPAADGWYLLSTASDHAADGYSLQAMRCFGDGALAALSRQTVAIF
jgi:acyl-CoA thioesterase